MNIVAIAGSLRADSLNRQLAEEAHQAVQRLDPSVKFTILNWENVPLFNEDAEFPAPAAVRLARQEIEQADGVWLFTPEYNHGIPGPLKNLLDWLSRPLEDGGVHVLFDKPVAISGISPAVTGTSHAQDQLLVVLGFIGARTMVLPRLVIGNALEQVEDGQLHLTSSLPYLERQAHAFVEFMHASPVG